MLKKVLILIGGIVFASKIQCMGLKASPAEFVLHDVVPGKFYNLYKEVNIRIKIYNEDDVSHKYFIRTYKPKKVAKLTKGYDEIPVEGWLKFDKYEIEIPPHRVGYVYPFLYIPEDEKYFNQHWCAMIGIIGQPSSGVSLGVYLRVRIETQSKKRVKEKPDGMLAVVPSVIKFYGNGKKDITIYNNSPEKEEVKIYLLKDKKQIKRYLKHGFAPLDKNVKIKLPGKIIIEKNGREKFPVSVNLKEVKRNQEGIIFFEGKNSINFLRVEILKKNGKN